MEDKKNSDIKIKSEWKKNITSTNIDNLIYDNLDEINLHEKNNDEMQIDTQNEMIRIINKFDKKEHLLIYKLINTEKKNIFSNNGQGMFFSLKQLDNVLKWKLYKLVKLLNENIKRDKIKEQAFIENESLSETFNQEKISSVMITEHNNSAINVQMWGKDNT